LSARVANPSWLGRSGLGFGRDLAFNLALFSLERVDEPGREVKDLALAIRL
ncbi:unnamed protein product, partial [marine sediment metagenome]